MAGGDGQSEPLPPPDDVSYKVMLGVGLVTLLALLAVALMVAGVHDHLLAPTGATG